MHSISKKTTLTLLGLLPLSVLAGDLRSEATSIRKALPPPIVELEEETIPAVVDLEALAAMTPEERRAHMRVVLVDLVEWRYEPYPLETDRVLVLDQQASELDQESQLLKEQANQVDPWTRRRAIRAWTELRHEELQAQKLQQLAFAQERAPERKREATDPLVQEAADILEACKDDPQERRRQMRAYLKNNQRALEKQQKELSEPAKAILPTLSKTR